MKNEKNYMGFRIPKVWQILKHFTGIFHWAQTLKLWGVIQEYTYIETKMQRRCIRNTISFWKRVGIVEVRLDCQQIVFKIFKSNGWNCKKALVELAQYLLLQAESKEENATQKVPLKHFGVTSKGQKTRENYHFFPSFI